MGLYAIMVEHALHLIKVTLNATVPKAGRDPTAKIVSCSIIQDIWANQMFTNEAYNIISFIYLKS